MLRGFQKYITLGVFRDIRLKFFSRLGNINLLKVLGSLLTELHLLRGFRKYITLRVFREIRMMESDGVLVRPKHRTILGEYTTQGAGITPKTREEHEKLLRTSKNN